MMRALTLWRPWHFAILHLDKRVENRPWRPWAEVLGKRIALHAGKYWDHTVLDVDIADPRSHYVGVVGTAVVRGWVHLETETLIDALTFSRTLTRAEAEACTTSRWFFGPYGWVLGDVRALDNPIPCRGEQGLWTLPADIELQLQRGGCA